MTLMEKRESYVWDISGFIQRSTATGVVVEFLAELYYTSEAREVFFFLVLAKKNTRVFILYINICIIFILKF